MTDKLKVTSRCELRPIPSPENRRREVGNWEIRINIPTFPKWSLEAKNQGSILVSLSKFFRGYMIIDPQARSLSDYQIFKSPKNKPLARRIQWPLASICHILVVVEASWLTHKFKALHCWSKFDLLLDLKVCSCNLVLNIHVFTTGSGAAWGDVIASGIIDWSKESVNKKKTTSNKKSVLDLYF